MLYDYYPLIAALIGHFSAQIIKPFSKYHRTKKFDFLEIFAAGGFPSSHTSTMTALALSLGIKDGFSSSTFFIAFIVMLIIGYDAMNVRLYTGKNIAITRQLIDDLRKIKDIQFDDPIYFTKMKQILGHERFEVFGGFILGIIVSITIYILLGGQF